MVKVTECYGQVNRAKCYPEKEKLLALDKKSKYTFVNLLYCRVHCKNCVLTSLSIEKGLPKSQFPNKKAGLCTTR